MATEAYKVIAQAEPAASILTDVFTVPASTEIVISSVVISNTAQQASPQDAFVRVSIAIGGAADSIKQYLVYDTKILKNNTLALVLGITLAATDKIRVFSDQTDVAFNFFGTEIT